MYKNLYADFEFLLSLKKNIYENSHHRRLHLKSQNETPERYEVLNKIIDYLKSQDIKDLIIAGDLFDKEFHNYSDFENICRNNTTINFYIIRGNHDADLKSSSFSSPNIKVFDDITSQKI